MIRPVLTELAIFLIPFVAYALFLVATRAGVFASASWPGHLIATRAGVFTSSSWPARLIAKLVLGSLLLVIISFVLLAHFSGAPPDSTYVPAHIEDGRLVPGVEK